MAKKRRQTKRSSPRIGEAQAWVQIMVAGRSIEDRRDVSDASLRRRLNVMAAAILVLLSLLAVRIFSMQVVAGQNYQELANGNRIREEITYAPRGKIYDRNGKILANNTTRFELSLTPYLLDENEQIRAATIRRVGALGGIEEQTIIDALEKHGEDYVLPVPLDVELTHEQAIAFESMHDSVRGFTLNRVPSRVYDESAALAHIIGYTGRVSEFDLEVDQSGQLLPTDEIGKAGVELSFDDRLRGQNGWIRYEVDALGRPVRVLDSQKPQAGEDLFLSIDYELQKTLSDSIKKQMKEAKSKKGSGVAVDPQTGEVLALVSIPSYDNNKFVGGISQSEFAYYNENPLQPLYNDAHAGGFTSGSIIKPIVASAALQEGVVNDQTVIVDSGFIDVVSQYGTGSFRFRGWREGGLGPMNVRSAIAWSSNIYFYTVGGGHGGIQGLGEERLTRYYREFGLGEASGIALPGETAGRVPDEEWKLENKGEPWYVGDSYNISIGQGDLLISPLQITMAEATIANGGKLLEPQIERTNAAVVRRTVSVDPGYLEIVRQGMRQVLTGGTTCECTFKDVKAVVAGKSGTAETNTPDGRPPHAWFTAFAPYEQGQTNAQILATVLIEEGVGGSKYAAPAIAETFKVYFE